jgi:hypothetical protein
MPSFLIKSLIASIIFVGLLQDDPMKRIETTYDKQKNLTTVRLPSTPISGPKDRYHSLAFSIYYSYPAGWAAAPQVVNFELVSVVKARRLNSDLYVVFLIDGKPIHFSSNRSAIRNPVPGRLWIGERMVFRVPYEDFRKMAAAKKLGVKLGGVTFDFSDEMHADIKAMAQKMRDSARV